MKTKYNLGDLLVPIWRSTKEKYVVCDDCEGTGYLISRKGVKIQCPNCSVGLNVYTEPDSWRVAEAKCFGSFPSPVGQIYEAKGAENYIRYMIQATGIGSGSNWNEKDLFRSIAEAQAECDRRNNDGKG